MNPLKLILKKKGEWFLRRKFISDDLFKLSKNVFFSGSSQLITLISPLIITPYLIRVLGIELFGILIMAQSIMMYFSYLVDYSFNIDATQEASIKRNNVIELSKLFSDITWTRVFLLMISGFVLIILIYIIPTFFKYKELFMVSYTIIIGRTMLPQWLLVGTEHMKEMAILTTVSKIIVYMAIFLLVHSPKDFLYINIIWGLGDIIVGPAIYLFLKSKLKIKLSALPDFSAIKSKLINGWPIFISNSMTGLYIYSNITILGLFATPHLIGSFAVAEKVMLLIKQVAGTIFQATYPHACKLSELPGDRLKIFLKQEAYVFIALFLGIGLLVVVLSNYIVFFFVGKYDSYAIDLLNGLAFVPFIVSLNMPASQMMLIKGIRKKYAKVVLCTGILNITANFVLAPIYGPVGTVVAIILTEIFNAIAVHYSLFRYNPDLQIFNINRFVTYKQS